MHTEPSTSRPARRPARAIAFDLRALPDGLHPDDAEALEGGAVAFEVTTDPDDPDAC